MSHRSRFLLAAVALVATGPLLILVIPSEPDVGPAPLAADALATEPTDPTAPEEAAANTFVPFSQMSEEEYQRRWTEAVAPIGPACDLDPTLLCDGSACVVGFTMQIGVYGARQAWYQPRLFRDMALRDLGLPESALPCPTALKGISGGFWTYHRKFEQSGTVDQCVGWVRGAGPLEAQLMPLCERALRGGP